LRKGLRGGESANTELIRLQQRGEDLGRFRANGRRAQKSRRKRQIGKGG